MSGVGLIVELQIKDGASEEFLALIGENARKSIESEPGCRQFDVLRVAGEPSRFMLYEIYADEAAFQAHLKAPHVAEFFAKARPLFTRDTAHRVERVLAPAKR